MREERSSFSKSQLSCVKPLAGLYSEPSVYVEAAYVDVGSCSTCGAVLEVREAAVEREKRRLVAHLLVAAPRLGEVVRAEEAAHGHHAVLRKLLAQRLRFPLHHAEPEPEPEHKSISCTTAHRVTARRRLQAEQAGPDGRRPRVLLSPSWFTASNGCPASGFCST